MFYYYIIDVVYLIINLNEKLIFFYIGVEVYEF